MGPTERKNRATSETLACQQGCMYTNSYVEVCKKVHIFVVNVVCDNKTISRKVPNLAEEILHTKNTVTKALPVQPASTEAVASVAEVQDVNDNGLNLLPECKDACFIGRKNIGCSHCHTNVQINKVFDYIFDVGTLDTSTKSPTRSSSQPNYSHDLQLIKIQSVYHTPSLKVKKNSLLDSGEYGWGVINPQGFEC
jgi:hypothetical protein